MRIKESIERKTWNCEVRIVASPSGESKQCFFFFFLPGPIGPQCPAPNGSLAVGAPQTPLWLWLCHCAACLTSLPVLGYPLPVCASECLNLSPSPRLYLWGKLFLLFRVNRRQGPSDGWFGADVLRSQLGLFPEQGDVSSGRRQTAEDEPVAQSRDLQGAHWAPTSGLP